jgi:hypothetical protein
MDVVGLLLFTALFSVLGHVIKAGLALFSTGLPYSAQEIQEPLSAAARV